MKGSIASFFLRLIASTWSVRFEGPLPQRPCIVAFWHGEMLPIWFAMRSLKPVALVSASSDGSLLARLLQDWGYIVVRGSSTRGGGEALQELVNHADKEIVMMTPDGPRGPIHICKPGAIVAAQRAGVPLILVRAYTSRAKVFEKSWDKFIVPTLFSHITIHISHEIEIPVDLNREQTNDVIENVQRQLNILGSVVC